MSARPTLDHVLKTWIGLNDVIYDYNEGELMEILVYESENKCRMSFINRLYGRLQVVRKERELQALFNGNNPWK